MKDFMEENFTTIILAIVAILGMCVLFHAINKEYEFYEKVLEHRLESNTAVEIKQGGIANTIKGI